MSSSDIVRAAGRFRDVDARLEESGLRDLTCVQKAYVRELQTAMAEADVLIEVEALKSLGDVFLEKGRISGVLVEFGKAHSLYSVALVRCTHIGEVQTLLHRVKYARAFIDQKTPQNQHGNRNKPNREVNQEQEQSSALNLSPSDRLKIAETVQERLAGLTEESLPVGYVNLLVESVVVSDVLAEVEALKGLGDAYLRRGGVSRDMADFTRASSLYSAGLVRCQDADNRDALRHRVRYTARLRKEEIKGKHKMYEGKVIEIQYKYPSDNIDSDGEEELVQSESNIHSAESSYEDQYEAGVSALRSDSLESAERNFASALRSVHGNQEEMAKEVSCLYRLGDVHVAKGKNTGEGKCFTQAAALYNGALVRTDDATVKVEINEKLKDTEVSFLQHVAHTDCRLSLSDVDRGHKEAIQNTREKVKKRLESIDQRFNVQAHQEDHRAMTTVEAHRADAIKDLFVEIAQSRKEFVGTLVGECMEVLGPAPCTYAVIGLGSQATETVTPYSDLEFAILLKEGSDTDEVKQYFRHLTHYVHLKVINLGETIIPAMAIKSLNDFESENPADNWFYDSATPRGFAFDGSMPWASKTPLGRDKTKAKPALELIRCPSSMAELQQENIAVSEGYHLSDILRNVCCLTGNDGLVDEYMKIVNETLTNTRRREGSVGVLHAGETLAKDVERYGKQGLTAKLLDVKKDIYRFPTISIDSLCVLCGLKPGSVWKVISDMVESNILTRENADHLKVLVSISAELRLRTYLANGKQWETMSALSPIATDGQTGDHGAAFKSVFYLPDDDMLFRYHYRAIPLEKLLSSLSTDHDHLPESLRRLRSTTLFDAGSSVKARICIQLLKRQAAICHLEDDVALLLNTAEPFRQLEVLDYVDEGCISDESLSALLRRIATAWKLLGNSRKAISYYEMALRIVKTVHGRGSCHPVIASIFGDLGSAWLTLDENEEALGFLTIAHKMREDIYGADPTHPEIVSSLGSLSEAWQYRGDFRKAMSVYEQNLRVTKVLYKDDDLKLATCLQSTGGCLSNLGIYRKAIRYKKKALKIIQSIYGHSTGHPRVVSALKDLGQCHIDVGNHRTGIYYLEQALNAWKIVYGERAVHPDIASALSDLGLAWNSAGDFIVSQKYHDLALKMRRDVYGVDAAHSDIAYSLQNIGFSQSNEGKHKEALQYQEQALAMLKRVHGDEANHPDIANALNHLGNYYR
ncbi:KLC4 [Branchiostoma lanceolatum]|uniref:KLC4 protein n=1 Tax=Branchiostoma lanceolatum TaxID=7740 RepID=A0A8K0A4S9_BRALA|nr:KLC4 [Branchiostoma lanceolatum]